MDQLVGDWELIDGAEVIVLDCTIGSGSMKEFSEGLKVPVIGAVVVSWTHSKLLRQKPHRRKRDS